MAGVNDMTVVVTDALSGSLGADVRTVIFVGITLLLTMIGLRFILGMFGITIPSDREEKDDDD